VTTLDADLDPENPNRILLGSTLSQREMIKTVPGALWDRTRNRWHVPLSWTTCLALRATFKDDLVIGPALNAWALRERETRIAPAMAARTLSDAPGDPDLYPHQRADIQFLLSAQQAILGNDPGVGKTASAVRAAMALYRDGVNPFPILVVTPNTVKRTWVREFNKWWPGLTVTVIGGTAAQRRKQLATPSHVFIINWESLRGHSRLAPYGSVSLKRCGACGGEDSEITAARCEVHTRELNEIDFGLVVADEVHRAKDPKAKATRALWAATGNAPYRFGLTGTPIANDATELWPILHWLAPQEWPSKTRWLDRMVDIMYNAFGGVVVSGIRPEREEEFFAGFHPRFRRVIKSTVLKDLPPIVPERRDVEMSAKQKKAYEQMRDELLAEVDGGLLMAPTVLTRTMRLLQLTSSYGEIEPDPADPDHPRFLLSDPSSKIDQFMDDLPDFGDQSVVVFAVSRQLINLLSARMTKAKIPHGLITGDQTEWERDKAITDFQDGRIKYVLCTIAAGGVGITLSRGSVMVFLQRSWSLVEMIQAENRCQRPGSEIHDSILRIDYVVPGTVEEAVIYTLSGKGQKFEDIVRDKEAIRRMLLGDERDEDAA
jgi:SNF2 family DNA or RNA helicase